MDVITLHQLPTAFGLPVSVSPFCTKLEAYLKLAGHDYRVVTGGPNRSPTRRMPFVSLSDGRTLAGSNAVIVELERTAAGNGMDTGMLAEERARAERLRMLAEGPLYYGCLYARFVEEGGWRHQQRVLRGVIPPFVAPIAMPLVRRSQRRRCLANGIVGRQSYETVLAAIDKLENALTDTPYISGDRIRSVDCSIWAMLLHTAHTKADNPARHAVRRNARLLAYIDRIAARAQFALPELPVMV